MLETILARVLSRITEFSVATGDATATITIVDYSGCGGDTVTVTIDTTDHVLTEGVDWARGSSNAAAASSLAAAINLLTGVSAGARDAVVLITAIYNITALATSGGADITISDAGSTTTLFDANAVWEVDKWKDAIVEITHLADAKHYYPTITSNTADTLTFGALAVTIAPGDHYEIRMALRLADIDKWGGTALTGRDISLDLANITKLIPLAKAAIFNTALPAAEADWLGSDITPTNSPSYLRIYACVSVAGVLRVARTISATTLTEDLNSGNNLVAGAAYMFTVPWRSGDGINIRYSVTTGTINRLLIDEIGGAE